VVRFANLSNWLAYRLKIFLPVGARRWLAEHICEFDVAHLFEARTMLNAHAAEEAARQGVPFVLSALGSQPRGSGWRSWIKGRYDRQHGARLLGGAAALLAQNEHEGQLYREYGAAADRVVLWPLAVDPAEFAELPERGRFRQQHGIGPQERVVLFVGRINVHKGIDVLLRAFAAARQRVPESRLVLVGRDDGELARLNALAGELGVADRFLFVGPLYGRDNLPAYVDCDLFSITPTHFEETSLASLGACACGRPVLINDRCGIPWLEEYGAGRCVPHSQENVTRALAELLSDPAGLEQMGRDARRMVEEKLLWPRVVEQAEDVYRRAVAAGEPARDLLRQTR
jgi:glycosyltransferase involved in cell wall biosynthesis